MLRWLQSLYKNLPLVREVRDIRETGWKTQGMQNRLLWLLQDEFITRLLTQPRYADPRHLARASRRVFSQHGEDGITAEIFRRVKTTDRFFVEIGTGDGLENNTAFLFAQGWRGVWVDGDKAAIRRAADQLAPFVRDGKLTPITGFVTRENIGAMLRDAGVPAEFDFLSLDVDQNTYWVWDGLRHLRPRVLVVEYNSGWPPDMNWKVSYDPHKTWDGSFTFGASLKAFELLGHELGYQLVGCDLTGVNAFFVRTDLTSGDQFVGPFDAENCYEPFRPFLALPPAYPPAYSSFFGG